MFPPCFDMISPIPAIVFSRAQSRCNLGCFGQANYVVDQQCHIDILHTGELKGLMVDEDHRAVVWIEQVADSCVSGRHRYFSL